MEESEIVAFFFGSPSGKSFEECALAVLQFQDITFAYSDEQAVKNSYNIQSETLVLFYDSGESREDYTIETQKQLDPYYSRRSDPYYQDYYGSSDHSNFLVKYVFQFIQKSVPVKNSLQVMSIEDLNRNDDIFDKVLLFYLKKDNGDIDSNEQAFRNVAQKYKGQMVLRVLHLEGRDLDFSRGPGELQQLFNCTQKSLPIIRILIVSEETKTIRRYIYTGDFSEDSIQKFVEDYNSGSLKAFYNTQPVPANPIERNLAVVVGSTFEEIVINSQKHVFIIGYEPPVHSWYGIEQLEILAGQLQNRQDIVFAKIDVSSNEIPGHDMRFHSQFASFYPIGNKTSPTPFWDDRTVDGYRRFLRNYIADI